MPALRMILGSPGGAGKSQVFDAIKEFYSQMGHASQIKITAPTGLAANHVGGSTIHSEASLRTKQDVLYTDTPAGQQLRSNLEERWFGISAHISDEIYFLGALDFQLMSKNLRLAK
ncbi:hypothetical protein M422DRAFT_263526 [Sphaerobolus stellatus SS14]|uniref:ATP-dependent DNA helicase n=1 Tax=Sphaerobolus stellatus (strain SS14) TaxID=990650 RepID=A0A0C9UHS0_SPHS4|nr:hypothetical protein M422DRAFT_263526 [Sphaerobolus stellatus SS14]